MSDKLDEYNLYVYFMSSNIYVYIYQSLEM
jgi:hypothetical protein